MLRLARAATPQNTVIALSAFSRLKLRQKVTTVAKQGGDNKKMQDIMGFVGLEFGTNGGITDEHL